MVTPLPRPMLREAAAHAGNRAMTTEGGVGGASLTEGGVAGASLVEPAVDLGDEVRYVRPSQDLGDEVRFVRPSQAQNREPLAVRGSVFRVSSVGAVDSLNNANRRAILDAYRKRLLIMLQVVQFDNPLSFLIARTWHSMKRVFFCSEVIQFYSHSSRPTPASLVLTPPIPLTRSCCSSASAVAG